MREHDETDELPSQRRYSHNADHGVQTLPDRKAFELIAASYLTESNLGCVEVRYDVVGILIIGESRALIRHHINALAPLGRTSPQGLTARGLAVPGNPSAQGITRYQCRGATILAHRYARGRLLRRLLWHSTQHNDCH